MIIVGKIFAWLVLFLMGLLLFLVVYKDSEGKYSTAVNITTAILFVAVYVWALWFVGAIK